jgi:DNA-binding CsgD family transcriptional regulator
LIYFFESYAFDSDRRELSSETGPIPLQPQVLDILERLIRHHRRVGSRDDMLGAVGGGRIVSQSTLATRVTAARAVLGDPGVRERPTGAYSVGAASQGRRPVQRAAATAVETLPAERRRLAILSCEFALDAFEASGSPAAVIDGGGGVLRLNRHAERLLGADLKIVNRRLVSIDRDATVALDRALHGLIWSRQAEPPHPPIVLPRRSGRAILAYPSRAPGRGPAALGPRRGFVVFVDLEARRAAAPGDLARAFGLTPAEARLASRLSSGEAVGLAAAKLGIAYETARCVLKSIFQKTDTHRQAQLVSLLSRIAQRPADEPNDRRW